MVRMAEHLSVVGEQVVMRHKNTTAHGCVIVGEVTCRAIPYRTYDPPMREESAALFELQLACCMCTAALALDLYVYTNAE